MNVEDKTEYSGFDEVYEIICDNCESHCDVRSSDLPPPEFCPFCGAPVE
jgi:rubrerythrin